MQPEEENLRRHIQNIFFHGPTRAKLRNDGKKEVKIGCSTVEMEIIRKSSFRQIVHAGEHQQRFHYKIIRNGENRLSYLSADGPGPPTFASVSKSDSESVFQEIMCFFGLDIDFVSNTVSWTDFPFGVPITGFRRSSTCINLTRSSWQFNWAALSNFLFTICEASGRPIRNFGRDISASNAAHITGCRDWNSIAGTQNL